MIIGPFSVRPCARSSRGLGTRLTRVAILALGVLALRPSPSLGGDDCTLSPLFPTRAFTAGFQPQHLAVGDVSGDGVPDMVVGTDSTISVLLGRGDGTYHPAQTFGSQLDAVFVALGDIDGDGDLDVAASEDRVRTIKTLHNNGEGIFTLGPSYAVVEGGDPIGAQHLAFGDFDADGDADLAVNTSLHVAVLINNGSGAYTIRRDLANAEGFTLQVADVDRDLDLDIVTADRERIAVTRNNGNGTFRTPVHYPDTECDSTFFTLGDVDNDGDLDLLTPAECHNGVRLRRNSGAGAFGAPALIPVPHAQEARVVSTLAADLDGDGAVDLAVGTTGSGALAPADCTVHVLRGLGNGTFGPAQPYRTASGPSILIAADLDHDKDLDIAFAAIRVGPTVMLNSGDGTFPTRVDYPSGGFEPRHVALGDLDGDSDLDVVIPNELSGNLTVYTNHDGRLVDPVSYPAGDFAWFVALGDLDADGDVDAAIGRGTSGAPRVDIRFNSAGVLGPATTYTAPGSPTFVALADLDADGDLDMATSSNNATQIWKNTGSGAFDPPVAYIVGFGTKSIAFADFDGDADPDLCAMSGDSRRISIRLNNGSGMFGAESTYPTFDSPRSLDVGDMDHDGDVDVVVASPASPESKVSVFRNNGNGTFAPRVDYPAVYPYWVRLADLDHDEDLDVVTAPLAGTTVSVLHNSGAGVLFGRADYAAELDTRAVTLGDMNHDGNIDIVSTSVERDVVSVIPNIGVYAPRVTRQPAPAAACAGDAVSFTAAAIGTLPLSYQWRKDGVDIPGATSPTLSLAGVTIADAGAYALAVTNSCRTAVSPAATLTVGGRADWNHDGAATSDDVSAFLADWFIDQANGTLITDVDANGVANSTDVSDFISTWFADVAAGC